MRAEILYLLLRCGCLPHDRVRTTRLLIHSKLGERQRQKYCADEERLGG
jgi:hypothetical protein